MRSYLALFFLSFVFSAAAQQGFTVDPTPSWVEPVPVAFEVSDTANISGGYYYLLINQQRHLELTQYHYHYFIKVISEEGLSYASQINESFDPSFQKLAFNSLTIHRDGKTIQKLDKNKFELLRREEGMDRAIYDKTLSVVYNIPDVRVGDVVEYSLTITGSNPVFGNHRFGSVSFNYSMPAKKVFQKVLHSSDRKLQLKYFNQEIAPTERNEKGLTHLSWSLENVQPLLLDDATPRWFDPYARVQVSDFQSWAEVKSWARNIFEVKQKNGDEMNALLERIRQLDKAAQIRECIRFVQGEIRYLSFSDGIHGYKPHNPNEVLSQKFGDCKDKSLLLSHLLQQLGIESYPALVSTEIGHTLPELLPYPYAFNHCIVALHHKDSVYWIDPTLSTQVGELENFFVPAYEYALTLDNKNTGLSTIPFGYRQSQIDINEEYFVDRLDGDVTLKVQTTYTGDEADNIRSYRATTSQAVINKNYLNFYASDYPDITMVKDVSFADDAEHNVMTCQEEYTIRNYWVYDSLQNRKTASIYARVLATFMVKPETKVRSMPLHITHPRNITQNITIYLPEPWPISSESKTFGSEAFEYKMSVEGVNTMVVLSYQYRTKKSFIEAPQVQYHVEQLDKAQNDLAYGLYYTPNNGSISKVNYPFLLLTLVIGAAVYLVFKRLYDYNPEPRADDTLHYGIGGWLVLLAIGMIFNPIINFYALFTSGFYEESQWRILTDTNYALYNPKLGALVVFELVTTIMMLGFSILIAILFFQRRTSVPNLVSLFFGLSIVVLGIDTIWGFAVNALNDEAISDSLYDVVKLVIRGGIWIPYLYFSERSKGTFTVRV